MPATAQWNAQRERMTHRHSELREFDRELKDLDPLLSLVRAAPHAEDPDLIPGFWHVKRENPIGMDTYLALKSADGGFSEPHSGFIEQLRRQDLQRDGAWDELMKRLTAEEDNRLKAQQETREELKQEFAERYKAHADPGVSMTDTGWTYKKRGRRGRSR